MKKLLILFVALFSLVFQSNNSLAQHWRFLGQSNLVAGFFDEDNIKENIEYSGRGYDYASHTFLIKTKWFNIEKLMDKEDEERANAIDSKVKEKIKNKDENIWAPYFSTNPEVLEDTIASLFVLFLEAAANYDVGPPPYFTAEYEIDCRIKSIRSTSSVVYDDEGEVTNFSQEPTEWFQIERYSCSENMYHIVCKKELSI